MSEKNDIDIAALMQPRSAKVRAWISERMSSLLHRGWVDGEAEVTDCTASTASTFQSRYGQASLRGAYVVGFTYRVEGRDYDGTLPSPDRVEKGDKFAIRYDPRHPEKNNTFESTTNWTTTYSIIFSAVMILIFVFLFVRSLLVRN